MKNFKIFGLAILVFAVQGCGGGGGSDPLGEIAVEGIVRHSGGGRESGVVISVPGGGTSATSAANGAYRLTVPEGRSFYNDQGNGIVTFEVTSRGQTTFVHASAGLNQGDRVEADFNLDSGSRVFRANVSLISQGIETRIDNSGIDIITAEGLLLADGTNISASSATGSVTVGSGNTVSVDGNNVFVGNNGVSTSGSGNKRNQ